MRRTFIFGKRLQDTRPESEKRAAEAAQRDADDRAKREWLETHEVVRLPTMYAWFV